MHRARVLVVDDDTNARSALSELLCDAGYEVALAATGRAAIALLGTFHPDLVLTEVQMPTMGGRAVASAARRSPDAPRIVFMSAYPPPVGERDAWLAKPIDVGGMLDTVGHLVG